MKSQIFQFTYFSVLGKKQFLTYIMIFRMTKITPAYVINLLGIKL